ncbi:hypothetical protein [Comamonas kerstersii]|jgi:predicted ribonuclease YlaK|uniref:Uncharacterized protein n=1 Tax=Comamonas kerstersii TaxID=225992 RepID=A0A0W7YXK2_9BURK|nr:hypothetical protein [Comamonas kerstersii]AQZ97201.1 hypothetical protein B5M06_01930 [Comamonas kerstersii]KAB0587016.1 hypothetical protein F7P80_08515 [Comamonas kerstersii]KUF39838.1 hypothetical protein AS359_13395 [Comamonas kerstersii]OOH88306.1 hypothetical protein BMF38_02470 [Comamonas kerstersii]OOH91674.1 hypothetical protein BMF29_10435 [Comamonas kerstersii]
MAISWVSALKLVPWGDVIQAAPTVLKAAKGLMKKSPEQELEDAAQAAFPASAESQTPAANAGELALQKVAQLEARIQQLEAAQRASNQVLEKMAEQQAQIVKTVGLLRTGATRLAWACGILSVAVIGLLVYSF